MATHVDGETPALAAFGLRGKTALITGAASGLGKATALLFLEVGAQVVIADLNGAAALSVAAELAAFGPTLGVAMDVAEQESVSAAFTAAGDKFGDIDILVNNAAYRSKADTMTMPLDEWDRMHAVNARGSFICLREAVVQMRRKGGGSIVNISSMSAQHPTIFPNMHYDSSKAGVDAITRLAAVEFAKDNIRVNSVLPGGMDTQGGANIRAANVAMAGPAVMPGRNPLGRIAQPIEMARAILFLASEAASYVTGVELLVDGGFTKG
ncbi:MAG: short chain dehydrogenase family protein [Bradyrhizobium sp.]|nr:short chain dehydrogenase family protein [Bradyrhizobium sp.]